MGWPLAVAVSVLAISAATSFYYSVCRLSVLAERWLDKWADKVFPE